MTLNLRAPRAEWVAVALYLTALAIYTVALSIDFLHDARLSQTTLMAGTTVTMGGAVMTLAIERAKRK